MPRLDFFLPRSEFVGVITLVGLLLVLVWQSTEVILLIFAGLLAAVFLDGCAEFLVLIFFAERTISYIILSKIRVFDFFSEFEQNSVKYEFTTPIKSGTIADRLVIAVECLNE